MVIPDLSESLYNSISVPECILLQIEKLKKSNVFEYLAFANKLQVYYDFITNRCLLKKHRDHFNNFYDEIDKNYPELLFRLEGGRKSWISAYQKMWKSKGSIIKDISAFRITLFGDNNLDLLMKCYTLAEHLILYSAKQGFILCKANPVKDTKSFDPNRHPDIILTKESGLPKNLRPYVKDYILSPKNNGYQSIHIIFQDTDGNYFEVQIRTIFMHMIAEAGSADHDDFKGPSLVSIDREKIHMPGYYTKNGQLFDWIGLEERLEILRRQKTF